jgi:hypothetical protein
VHSVVQIIDPRRDMLLPDFVTSAAERPVISCSMAKIASIRVTASSAMGELSSATFLALRASILQTAALISANSTNLRLAWHQHSADRTRPSIGPSIGPGLHSTRYKPL